MKIQVKDCDFINNIIDNSVWGMTRYRVHYTNGILLSVIRGEGSIGYENGLFEVMIMNFPYVEETFDITSLDVDYPEDALGNISEEDLVGFIVKLGTLPLKNKTLDYSTKPCIIKA